MTRVSMRTHFGWHLCKDHVNVMFLFGVWGWMYQIPGTLNLSCVKMKATDCFKLGPHVNMLKAHWRHCLSVTTDLTKTNY